VCVVTEGTQLLIRRGDGAWCPVQMVDGAPGYVARSDIRLTGVLVRQEAKAPRSEGRSDVVTQAQRHLGSAYVWGGASPRGADCSGFVSMVFARSGTVLPRAADAQADVGRPVLATELCAGDRLYFRSGRGPIDHTGIYIGDGRFIHASGRHGRVVISRLDDPYYIGRYACARR
jgi:cell wall-associated NlpC family hydrolase